MVWIGGERADSNDSFKSKSIPARDVGYFMGSLLNFLLPIILFSVFLHDQWYSKPIDQPILGTIMEDKAAAQAGFAGDRILAINELKRLHMDDLTVPCRVY